MIAEPLDPYDYDDEEPTAVQAWRYGYFELVYDHALKTLTLSRGPKCSVRNGKSCRACHGSGYLSGSVRTPGDRAAISPIPRCPTCPTSRTTLFKDVPLWPVHTLYRLRTWRRRRRVQGGNDAPCWPGQGHANGYSDEPPF